MDGRDEELNNEYCEAIETVLDDLEYGEFREEDLEKMYVELQSDYRLYHEWGESEEVDWVVVDDFLKRTAHKANRLYKAVGEEPLL